MPSITSPSMVSYFCCERFKYEISKRSYLFTTAQQCSVSYASPTSTILCAEHGLALKEQLPPSTPHDGRQRPPLVPHCGEGCVASPHSIGAQRAGIKGDSGDCIPARMHEMLLALNPTIPSASSHTNRHCSARPTCHCAVDRATRVCSPQSLDHSDEGKQCNCGIGNRGCFVYSATCQKVCVESS